MAADPISPHDPTIVELPSSPEMLIIAADFPGVTPQQLFGYWTEADLITEWWPQQAAIDARPGGKVRLAWPSMNWYLYGTYTAFEPGRELGFTWKWEHEPDVAPTDVKLHFATIETGTRLTLTHGPHPDTEEGRTARQGHVDGWMHFLPKLQNLALAEAEAPA